MNSTKENSKEIQRNANSPAGVTHVNLAAARGDVTPPPTAALSSEIPANPASLNWGDSEMAEVDSNDVRSKKRRRGSTSSEHAAKQPSRPAEKRSSQQQKRPTEPRTVPPQEIKATRANIADARARQTTSNHENYIFVELCPEIPSYAYLRAIDKLVGGPRRITQFNRMNGHYIVGLAGKDLANRLVEEGLDIEGTHLKVFPFRKRAERIIIANLPGFVEDSTIVEALRPHGNVISIAPIMIKMGEYTFTDGRREAFILLREGVKLETLPTRLNIKSKGDTLPAFLSFGIKCSKCGKQGHRRANCPSLARQTSSPRQAASPTDASPSPSSSSSAAKEARTCACNTGVPYSTCGEANRGSSNPFGAPACRTGESGPARPCCPPCSSDCPAAPRARDPSARPRDVGGGADLTSLHAFPERGRTPQGAGTSRQVPHLFHRQRLPSLPEAQAAALVELTGAILDTCPGSNSTVYKTLRNTKVFLKDGPNELPRRQHQRARARHSGEERCPMSSPQATSSGHRVCPRDKRISSSGQDLCFGYNAVVLAHPVAISGSGLACVFGPGVAVCPRRGDDGNQRSSSSRTPREEPTTRARRGDSGTGGGGGLLDHRRLQHQESGLLIIIIVLRGCPRRSSGPGRAGRRGHPVRRRPPAHQSRQARRPSRVQPPGPDPRPCWSPGSRVHLRDLPLPPLGPPGLVLLQVGPPTAVSPTPTQPRLAAMLRSGLALEHLAGYIRELEEDITHDDDDGILWDRWITIKAGLLAEARSLHDPRHAASDSYVYRARRYIAGQLEASSIRADYPSLPDLARAIRLRRPDGLPCELLVTFNEDFFAGALARVFAASRLRGALPPSTRRSSICLVPKARDGGRGLESLGPSRCPRPTTGCLPPFFTGASSPTSETWCQNARHTPSPGGPRPETSPWDAIEEATALGSPLAIMGVDLEPAFDSLDRGFLESLLTSLRLPPAFMSWINILYAGADATIGAEGFNTTAFPLLNGLRQGCAVSAALFSIATGPLLRRLELTLGVGNVIAYADDIVLLFNRNGDFEGVASVLEDYRQASGIGVNLWKSAGLWCGAWRNRGDSPLGASWSTTSIRVLGLDIVPRITVSHLEQHLLALLETACRRWTPFTRGLSLIGRARAANSLVGSTIQHHLHGYLSSSPTIAKLQARLASFGCGAARPRCSSTASRPAQPDGSWIVRASPPRPSPDSWRDGRPPSVYHPVSTGPRCGAAPSRATKQTRPSGWPSTPCPIRPILPRTAPRVLPAGPSTVPSATDTGAADPSGLSSERPSTSSGGALTCRPGSSAGPALRTTPFPSWRRQSCEYIATLSREVSPSTSVLSLRFYCIRGYTFHFKLSMIKHEEEDSCGLLQVELEGGKTIQADHIFSCLKAQVQPHQEVQVTKHSSDIFWGGWWERLIGMMKQLLFRILGQTSLGYEELSTVMCDVESLMNTRPLTYLTEESEDLTPLTPSLFLHEVREVGVPDLDLIDNQTLSRKYQYIKRVREDHRERFHIEYFGFLRQETRRLKTTIPFKVGDMVLIGQESLKRLHWPLARIIQLYPGKDRLVRVAKVKTSSGDKIRPIQKLYNLEITPEIRCRDPLAERSPTQEVRLTTEEDPLISQQEQHHIETPNVVSSYGRPIKRPNRLDLLNFSFPCLSRRGANSKKMEDFNKVLEEINKKIGSMQSDMESRLRRLENNVADVPVATPLSFRIADNSPPLETTECFSRIKPPTYDGQTSWKCFKTQFEVVALGNRWNSSEKAINLAASLRGSATEVLQSLPLEQSLDYERLIHALTLRFGDDILQPYHVVKLKNRRQKRDETLQELAADVERLARLAFPDCPRHVQDLLAHQNFVDAIEDPECQQSVRMSEAKTLQEALIHALKFEAARDATRGYQKVVRVVKTDESQKDGDIKEAISQLQRTVEEMKKTSLTGPGLAMRCDEASGKIIRVSSLQGGSNELATEGLVNGLPCRMVIDSGANVTLLRVDLAQRMESISRRIPVSNELVLQTATGEQAKVHGQVVLKFQIGNNLFSHLGYLADIKDDCLIGLDVLRKFGFSIDFQENVLKIAGEEIPLVCSRSSATNKVLKELLEGTREGLNGIQQKKLEHLLCQYEDVFATSPKDVGRTNVTQHRIDTGGATPVKQLPRRLPMTRRDEVAKLIEEMAEQDVIEPSSSPWASPVVLVKKKDGSTRFCVDYRRLNDLTKKDSYPLPRIDATLDTLSGSQWFSTLDLKSGYWQVSIHPEDREKTAFTTGNGLWQFKVMPFGLCNAPATFERLMETVLQGIPLETCLVYLDDIIVMGKSFEEHLINLERVLQKIRGARLKLNPRKCKPFKEKVRYLGHVISRQGIQTDPDQTETVRQWPVPRDVHQLRSFLGLCSYYRRFVPGFSNIARPLHRLTESGRPFSWTIDCERAMDKLKQAPSSPPMLAYPDPGEPFILDTDASNTGIGAVLSQTQDGVERVIAYFSKTLSKPERNYCVTRRELLAIVKSTEHFHHYLYGQKFLLRTDHAALRWLLNFKSPEGQLARWIQRLQEYDMEIQHRKGKSHGNADALSRRPCPVNCKHCSKAETQAELNIRQLSLAEELKLDEWSPEEMRKSQFEDADLRPVMNWLNAGTNRPAWEDVASCSPITKSYWSLWDSLEFRGGVLYRKWESDDGQHIERKMILPQSRVPSVLKELHNSPSGGHFGIAKTLGKVKERFYWAGCRASVEKWVRQCTECASRKGPKTRSRAKLKTYNVGAPFERIAIDIMGPLPRSDKGNRYILVAMDYFTKWPEAFPLADQEAETVAETLISQFFSRFGVPMQIHTDQGRNFESRLFAQMCKLLGSHKTRTTPLHPQSDGMVERFNRTLASQLSLFVAQNQRDWDSQLPILLMAYRSSVHETTGYSPAKMLFGRELKLPCDLIFGCPNSIGEGSNEFVDRLHSRLEKVHRWAREKLDIASEAMKVSSVCFLLYTYDNHHDWVK
ncbi:K02A2.6-like [Cordylochernes scorpioides]|uniref:RNA-directed DNA polymerase n=1 Tax=Cordylochernes scorpioides TaxID=51811 RepID=A0ABY6K883_9ARAC|nr:K02A2.6-like [Cordylochernes scorpioides]